MRAQTMRVSAGEDVATSEEVAHALAALGPPDIARLNLIAKVRARYAPGLEWRELLHEAIDKTLEGKRKWPRQVPFPVFLREVMRSLASEHRRKRRFGPVTTEADLPIQAARSAAIASAASDSPGPEREVHARQMVAAIFALFAGDAAVLAILEGMANGLDPAEIQSRAGLSAKRYASAQRRIRRGLARAYPNGVEQ